jgi:hypothetical protein
MFKESPPKRANFFCANERNAFAFETTPPFHLSLPFFRAAKKSPN